MCFTNSKKFFCVYIRRGFGRIWFVGPLLLLFGPIFLVWTQSIVPVTYLPGSEGELICKYVDISWHTKDTPLPGTLYAQIYGETVNSTTCINKVLKYHDEYYSSEGANNTELFREDIEKKFPLGGIRNCSVTSDCYNFSPFRDPKEWDDIDQFLTYGVALAISIAMIVIGLVFLSVHLWHAKKSHDKDEILPLSRLYKTIPHY